MVLRLRCAIYTRKSSEEGLEQDFNSLHAQREACEAYIRSQVGEGWLALPNHYDDGGFSGGSMERPGLKALLDDIGAGKVDIVVVYKVDRLTRSLADFAKIVEQFDARGVSFVSVTQAFNTTSSMGRLTLNVLLSFAQFEREVTSERIRDKIAASKAKGMWMGGVPPLGYDFKDRRLVANDAEAVVVRRIFQRYLEVGSVYDLAAELDEEGIRSKSWVTREGASKGGVRLTRGALFHILSSRVYLGEIVHRDKLHPGLHDPIVEVDLFDAVAAKLKTNSVVRTEAIAKAASAPLVGKLYDDLGQAFSPSSGRGKRGKLYRYYIAMDLQRGAKRQLETDRIGRLSAPAVEQFLADVLSRVGGQPVAIRDVGELVAKVELRKDETHVVIDGAALFPREHPELMLNAIRKRLLEGEVAVADRSDETRIRVVLPHALKLRGGDTSLHGAEARKRSVNSGLAKALRRAHDDLGVLNASPQNLDQAAEAEAPATQHDRLVSRLAFLSPNLQQRMLDGELPDTLTLKRFLDGSVPLAWADQEAWIAGLG
jgi:site-specific DNA recombinase